MPSTADKAPISAAAGILGERVRTQRTRLGLTQEALAERSELHWSYLGQVERGQNNLTLHNILRIAAALTLDPGELLQGLKPPAPGAQGSGKAAPARGAATRGRRN